MFDKLFHRRPPEVLVVGAGPVGLFTALYLVRRGVSVEVVDREWGPAAHSYALALHPQTLRLFDEVGLLESVLDKAYRVHRVGLYDGAGRRAGLDLAGPGVRHAFVAVTRQDVLENLLEAALRARGVKVHWNHQVVHLDAGADHAGAMIDEIEQESLGYSVLHSEWIVKRTQDLTVPFVIGADGYQSIVRRALGVDFAEVGPAQHVAVFEFETDADLQHELRLVLDEHTTSVLWPLPEGRCRWSFELEDYRAPACTRTKDRFFIQLGYDNYPVLDEAHLHALIAERAPWFTGRIGEVNWRILVRFERRLVSTFGRGRLWLVGDAAHMTGPAGVQSMNVGLREGAELAGHIADVLHGTTPEALEDFDRERQAEWRRLLGLSGGLEGSEQAGDWVRRNAARLLPALPASGDDLDRLVRTLGLHLTAGPTELQPASL